MTDFLDLIRCPVCGAFYTPEFTPTGRTVPHCQTPTRLGPHCALPVHVPDRHTSRGQRVEAAAIKADLRAIEARIVSRLLTEGVVGLPLTGSFLDIEA